MSSGVIGWGPSRPGLDGASTSARIDDVTVELIERAQCGDAAACRALVERFQSSVHALVWRMLGTRAHRTLVEVLVEEAFLRAFRSLPRFRPQGPAKLSTWVLSIAARTVIDELRRPVRPIDPLSTLPDDPAAQPDVAAQRRGVARAIARAVDELGPELRATFILRAYHELTYPEVAEALGVDVGTVKSRLHRARKALQTILQEVHDER